MPREVVTPGRQRDIDDVQLHNAQRLAEIRAKHVDEHEKRKARVADELARALAPLSPRDQQVVRRGVALSLPDREWNSSDDIQMWLDERVIGVARYMMTGRVK